MGKAPRRPAFVRCGDKKYLTMVAILTLWAMAHHPREIWREVSK